MHKRAKKKSKSQPIHALQEPLDVNIQENCRHFKFLAGSFC